MCKIIAVDFDGTLHDGKWPGIGNPRIAVILKILSEKRKGTKIILWTCRTGKELQEAVDWCSSYGLEFDTVNENLPEIIEAYGGENCRKIVASEYWDDLAVKV